uniref:Inositol-pentakisphosphate 2-kinase n=1 Tax=Mycena chlorophos TaxID=658473 RepID=A0ABQ0LG75_MYCCL|nr:predicted protein [Mycena chlorophos]
MSLSTTTIADWVYVGEGGANIVFSYRGPRNPLLTGEVLRLCKRALSSEPSCCEDVQLQRFSASLRLLHLETVPPNHLPRELPEALAKEVEASRPVERRAKDTVDLQNPRPVLATDLVGGNIAVESKPKMGFSPFPVVSLVCDARNQDADDMHSHPRGLERAYCPLDLYSGGEDRIRTLLEALWEGWERSGGERNNLRVFLDGERLVISQKHHSFVPALDLQTLLLRTLSHLQRSLDALDIEGLAARVDLDNPGTQPTLDEWAGSIAAFVAKSRGVVDLANLLCVRM